MDDNAMNQKRLNNAKMPEMPEYRLTRGERETHFIYNEADGEWIADSSIPRDIHKLERQHWIETGAIHYRDGSVCSKTFKAPRNCLSPRAYNPDKKKRVISDEQREQARVRMKEMWEVKSKSKN